MNYAFRMPRTLDENNKVFRRRKATSSESSGRYTPSPNDFVQSFYAVVRKWRSDTAFSSDPDQITGHAAFKALVDHADLVAPLIIDELRVRPSLLVWVLDDAISEKPYPEDAVGDIYQMTNAWIAWADRNGRHI